MKEFALKFTIDDHNTLTAEFDDLFGRRSKIVITGQIFNICTTIKPEHAREFIAACPTRNQWAEILPRLMYWLGHQGERQPLELPQMDIEAAYREGYEDAVRNYAVWRNGEQFVGALNRPLKGVLAEDLQKPIPVRY